MARRYAGCINWPGIVEFNDVPGFVQAPCPDVDPGNGFKATPGYSTTRPPDAATCSLAQLNLYFMCGGGVTGQRPSGEEQREDEVF